MDEIFSNSSSETVMDAADLSKVLANINQDIADLQYLELQLPPESEKMESHFGGQQQVQRSVRQGPIAVGGQISQQSKMMSHPNHKTGSTTNMAHIVNQLPARSISGPLACNGCPERDADNFAMPTVIPRSSLAARVPVITSVGKKQSVPQPQPRYTLEAAVRGGALRHTQSAVVERHSYEQSVRPRAQSTSATTQAQHQHVQYRMEYHNVNVCIDEPSHGYVNINPEANQLKYREQHHQLARPVSQYDNIPGSGNREPLAQDAFIPPLSAPPVLQTSSIFTKMTGAPGTPMPQYMNIPNRNYALASPLQKFARNLEVSGCSSAPSSPRGGSGRAPPPHVHHSYIELWTGYKEERDSLSDSECEELKRSFQEPQTPIGPSPGYVEMSSPYVKSPQVESPFNGSVLADLATKLASYAGHQPRNIFCPFCPRYFGYEKSLSSHIHKHHREELNSMVDSQPGDVKIQFCPICQARFFNVTVLPKHLIDFHRASVVEILEKSKCILSDASGIQCPFCIKKVPHGKTGEQVLLYHMQQLHLGDFEQMVSSKFQPYSGDENQDSRKSMLSVGSTEAIAFHPGITSTPGLSNKMGTMNLLSADSKRNMEALNLDSTWSSHRGWKRSPMPSVACTKNVAVQKTEVYENIENKKQLLTSASKGILRNKSDLSRKPSVKRELRFSVPPVTSEEVFVPESPEQNTPERSVEHQQQNHHNQMQQMENQRQEKANTIVQRSIPIRIDSLNAADFMDLNEKAGGGHRKRRRLGLGLRSRKAFKKKDKENIDRDHIVSQKSSASKLVDNAKKLLTDGTHTGKEVVPTQHTRTFRRPKPVPVPRVPELPMPMQVSCERGIVDKTVEMSDVSPFTHLKLYSPLRMFRCNSCRVKFCDNESLSGHIGSRHRSILHILRPQYGCGVCSARFYENKYLVKHCLQHHTSLLEIRSPTEQKISIYRFSHV